jgi:uncharacterized protein
VKDLMMTQMTTQPSPVAPLTQLPVIQVSIMGLGALGLAAVAIAAGAAGGWRQALLAVIGFASGIALYHASFGFTAAWRRMINEGRSVGIRAQIIMLALAIAAFFPLLAQGQFAGQLLGGFINPVGVALALGAFLFGIGMQLGGGCGSGTLFTVGGGSARMVVTLVSFIIGSVIATADPLGWMAWPDIGRHSLISALGPGMALVASAMVLAGLYSVLGFLERRRHGGVIPLWAGWSGDLLRGPWPLVIGAVALAVINIATLVVAGQPWGITSAFALWGAKILQAFGMDVSGWRYWQGDPALGRSVFADVTSVMNFGLMLGALAAAGAAGKFRPQARIPALSLLAAVLGGLLMGIGARMATGCNIGAFFSGTASGSLHGVVWLVLAIPGNWVGVRLRKVFALD